MGSSNQTWAMRGLTSISFLLCFISLAQSANFYKNTKLALKECVPLPQCKALNWLWRNRESIPTISQDNIEEFIFSLNCGLDICPKEKKVQNPLDRNPLIKGLKRNPVRKSSFAENVSYNCKAHLRLHMFKNNLSPNNPNNLYVQDIHARTATITDRSMKIYRIENMGSCCWEAYSKSHFTGDRETIFKKHDSAPKIQKLKTARVVIC